MMRMRKTATTGALGLLGLVLGLALVFFFGAIAGTGSALAGDKGGDKAGSAIAATQPQYLLGPSSDPVKGGAWSGFGVGLYGSLINADTDTVPSLGLTGQLVGVTVSYSHQIGAFVVEGFGEYGWMLGDLKDLGVSTEMAVGGRAGVLMNQQTLLYAVGARAWLDTDFGTIDGWQYGGGVALRLAGTPTVVKLEYRHVDWNTSGLIGVDATDDRVMAILSVQLGVSK